ncbi:hypothetical protein CVD25_00420 [Bacillus canaveralius]|uniref:Oligosaccharide repeat unit polymerase n=1 Tax=Bacillus canaveralius TaxID=1403243 RepID=A0A2N5GQA4_9BACI|nr:hypothetical protein [Bacillus canaveralius]PLR85057.1 hypothetical protein CU635_04565 [Bacillus canaveralius]PLS00945.1 hypothetical protein CVD25_00420 [Bacillus canaveralius]RSK54189.1 hypothetical protein EJA13_06345 [Bacillus canaveralius]
MKSVNKVNSKLFGPWKMFLSFFISSLILYLIGPWEYRNRDDAWMILYILIFILCSTFAYRVGIQKKQKKIKKFTEQPSIPTKLIITSIYVGWAISLYVLVYGFNKYGLPNSSSIASSMAQAYSAGRSNVNIENVFALQLYGNFSFFIYTALILGTLYFNKLNMINKVLIIWLYLNLSLYYIFYNGTQKNIADLFIILLSVKYIKFIRENKKFAFTKKTTFIIAGIIILAFFVNVLLGRAAMMNFSRNLYITSHYHLNFDHWMINWLPFDIGLAISLAIFYFSHGFYGLSLTLQQPFVWTYGLASIPNLAVVVTRIIGESSVIDGLTYPERVESATGYSAWSIWHTAFPWLASDYTFIGAVLILSVSAYIYGKTWREIVFEGKWQSVLLFTILNIQWLYMVANNQLFTARSTTMMFMVTLFLWIMRNKKIQIKK